MSAPAPPGAGTAWSGLADWAAARLGSRHDAGRIVGEVAGLTPAELASGAGSAAAPRPARARILSMVERRAAGEPLQYVLGSWGFRRLDLFVDRRVLIPRPETEQVVEVALGEIARIGGRTVVDLGTGSGAIALSVAVEAPRTEVWATDSSAAALEVVRANLSGLGGRPATRVTLCAGSWFEALPARLRGAVDVVVSNPPYVGDDEGLPAEVADWEPAGALRAGPSGLEAVEQILAGAPPWLTRAGVVVLEIAPHQAGAAADAARRLGYAEVDVRPDLAGRDRALVARRSACEA